MKKAAIILLILALAAAAGAGYLYLTCRVAVRAVSVTTVEASAQPEQFDRLRRQMENDAVTGILYSAADLSDASRYQFVTYHVTLSNTSFVDADSVELLLSPAAGSLTQQGDVLLLPMGETEKLPARSTRDFTVTLLTGINMHTVRRLAVHWYMWGQPFSLETQSSQNR